MQVRLTSYCDFGHAGQIIEVEANTALVLVKAGRAVIVNPPQIENRDASKDTRNIKRVGGGKWPS